MVFTTGLSWYPPYFKTQVPFELRLSWNSNWIQVLRNLLNTQSGNSMSRTKSISRSSLVVFSIYSEEEIKYGDGNRDPINQSTSNLVFVWFADLGPKARYDKGPFGPSSLISYRNFSIPALTVAAGSNCTRQPQQRLHSQLWLVSGRRTGGSHHRNHGIIGEAGLVILIY
jgi:hypothetical protein